jgi:hypothetical protein
MNSLTLPKRTHRSDGLTNPFHALNLWRNPFGELTRSQRAELALVDVDPWRMALEDSRTVLQFIGDRKMLSELSVYLLARSVAQACGAR